MNSLRNKRFLSQILPIFEELKAQCFDPLELPNNACPHCSLDCGGTRHDPECEYKIGSEIINSIEELRASKAYDLNYRDEPRPENEILEIKESEMIRIIIKALKPYLTRFIPLDYSDPDNEGVICECSIFNEERVHDPACPKQAIAHCLSELFKPSN